jgi:hypothetical protein
VETVVGIFKTAEAARRAAEEISRTGVPVERLSVLTPASSERDIHSQVATTETEQSGVGKALGGVVGGVAGVTTGMGLGAIAASILVPGFGAIAAAELLGAAILGVGGAAGGIALGEKLDDKASRGLPKDELYLYEDALRRGHSVVFALVDEKQADAARRAIAAEGAESLDAARESWWVGIRDAEKEDYEREGADFATAEPVYRRGFEAALRPRFRNRGYEEASKDLKDHYPEHHGLEAFRRGYDRGRRHLGSADHR